MGRRQSGDRGEAEKLPVKFEEEATEDLKEAVARNEQGRAGYGAGFYEAVQRAVELIRLFPQIGQRVDEEVRRVKVQGFPYGVIYLAGRDVIEVISVYHDHRDPKRLEARIRQKQKD